MTIDAESAVRTLIDKEQLLEQQLLLAPGECVISVASNSAALLANLGEYFSHVRTENAAASVTVVAIECPEPDLGIHFTDWPREPGKTGRKDSYHDLPNARIVRKVRTGMVFLQSANQCIAAGPCLANENQVINFINSQYMNWLQQQDWLICHASALVGSGGALGMAGFSGGGKSTLMLHLLEQEGLKYLTNDRLFLKRVDREVMARGIPKLPRVNPGTIVHNPRLHPLINDERRQTLLGLPANQLWDLEEKYDVHVETLYGADRIRQEAGLGGFMVLNWQRKSSDPCGFNRVDPASRPELMAAIMKSPGPFYQDKSGRFSADASPPEQSLYLGILDKVPLYEAVGSIDFEAAVQFIRRDILN